jgi:hypothetical protein
MEKDYTVDKNFGKQPGWQGCFFLLEERLRVRMHFLLVFFEVIW